MQRDVKIALELKGWFATSTSVREQRKQHEIKTTQISFLTKSGAENCMSVGFACTAHQLFKDSSSESSSTSSSSRMWVCETPSPVRIRTKFSPIDAVTTKFLSPQTRSIVVARDAREASYCRCVCIVQFQRNRNLCNRSTCLKSTSSSLSPRAAMLGSASGLFTLFPLNIRVFYDSNAVVKASPCSSPSSIVKLLANNVVCKVLYYSRIKSAKLKCNRGCIDETDDPKKIELFTIHLGPPVLIALGLFANSFASRTFSLA